MKKNTTWLTFVALLLFITPVVFSADSPDKEDGVPDDVVKAAGSGSTPVSSSMPELPVELETPPAKPAETPDAAPATKPAVSSPLSIPMSAPKNPSHGKGGINTYHSLEEVIGKINRASDGLAGIQDSSGHAARAAQYLKQALDELKAAKR